MTSRALTSLRRPPKACVLHLILKMDAKIVGPAISNLAAQGLVQMPGLIHRPERFGGRSISAMVPKPFEL